MFQVEYISLDTVPIVRLLCDSTLDLAEHNISLNRVRIVEINDLVEADFARAFYRGNRRNILSFDVTRAKNWIGDAFPTPEEAFVFALDHDGDLPGIGLVKITLSFGTTTVVRWLNNAAVTGANTGGIIGVSGKYTYVINAGAITPTKL